MISGLSTKGEQAPCIVCVLAIVLFRINVSMFSLRWTCVGVLSVEIEVLSLANAKPSCGLKIIAIILALGGVVSSRQYSSCQLSFNSFFCDQISLAFSEVIILQDFRLSSSHKHPRVLGDVLCLRRQYFSESVPIARGIWTACDTQIPQVAWRLLHMAPTRHPLLLPLQIVRQSPLNFLAI